MKTPPTASSRLMSSPGTAVADAHSDALSTSERVEQSYLLYNERIAAISSRVSHPDLHQRLENDASGKGAAGLDDNASLRGLAPSTVLGRTLLNQDQGELPLDPSNLVSPMTQKWIEAQIMAEDVARGATPVPRWSSSWTRFGCDDGSIDAPTSEAFVENIRYFMPTLAEFEIESGTSDTGLDVFRSQHAATTALTASQLAQVGIARHPLRRPASSHQDSGCYMRSAGGSTSTLLQTEDGKEEDFASDSVNDNSMMADPGQAAGVAKNQDLPLGLTIHNKRRPRQRGVVHCNLPHQARNSFTFSQALTQHPPSPTEDMALAPGALSNENIPARQPQPSLDAVVFSVRRPRSVVVRQGSGYKNDIEARLLRREPEQTRNQPSSDKLARTYQFDSEGPCLPDN